MTKKKITKKVTKPGGGSRPSRPVQVAKGELPDTTPAYLLWQGNVEDYLALLPNEPLFDLVITSPPYNIGKEYEEKIPLPQYVKWQETVISKIYDRLGPRGSICWQVGNYVENGHIVPLDIALAPVFEKLGMKLRNRIVWHFGHGLHNTRRFSGRYEVVLWYTKGDEYTFNLDDVRVESKYPGKRHHKGPKAGQLSGNPLGKNPEDVWAIPNVKANHVEKTAHPCQFPVGLIQRLILALSNEGETVFDPFAGVFTTGATAALHNRKFIGCEPIAKYVTKGKQRIKEALNGTLKFRPHDKPIYDHTRSKLSLKPEEWLPEDGGRVKRKGG